MDRLIIVLVVLGVMLAIMVAIAWLAIRESRREYEDQMRTLGGTRADRGRADPPFLTPAAAQPTGPTS